MRDRESQSISVRRRRRKTVEVMTTSKMSLKLLIDTKANKVLFAEGGKDFVDFLFGLLSLPVGAVIKLLKGRSSVGNIGNLYQSVGSLDESYLQPNLNKDIILSPKVSNSVTDIPLLMGCTTTQSINTKSFYSCNYNYSYVSNVSVTACPSCHNSFVGSNPMTRALTCVESNGVAPVTNNANVKGYVQGLVMYMISDDLSVTPMSMVSGITMMNKYNVSKLDLLEERVVDVGMEEGLELLKTSFQTKATLCCFSRQKRRLECCRKSRRSISSYIRMKC